MAWEVESWGKNSEAVFLISLSEEPVYWHWRTAEDLFKVVIAEVAWKLVWEEHDRVGETLIIIKAWDVVGLT